MIMLLAHVRRDESFVDDAPLLPSGFCIIPLDSGVDVSSPTRTLDLASALDVGPTGNSVQCYSGLDLLKPTAEGNESILKTLWHHSDVTVCCFVKMVLSCLHG